MAEEDYSQVESFHDEQPRRHSREANRRRGSPAIPAGLRNLEGGEFSVSVSQVPPVNPAFPQRLSDFIQSPGASPWGEMLGQLLRE